jgi:hypothetical protein
MVEHEVVHVAIAPMAAAPDEELVNKVAAILAKNPYDTRIRLIGKIPRIIASYDNIQTAESAAHGLGELGLVAMVCPDSELRKAPQIYRAHTLRFEEQAAIFGDKVGQERRIESTNVFLILSVRVQCHTETEGTKTVKKLNVALTLLTTMPVMKNVKEKTTKTSYESNSSIRLYDRLSPEPLVEIPQHNFDYSFLGTEKAASSLTNFNITITKIKNAFPQAIFDDSLVEKFGSDMHSAVPQENVEINCKLIYWYHQAVTNPGTSLQLQT